MGLSIAAAGASLRAATSGADLNVLRLAALRQAHAVHRRHRATKPFAATGRGAGVDATRGRQWTVHGTNGSFATRRSSASAANGHRTVLRCRKTSSC